MADNLGEFDLLPASPNETGQNKQGITDKPVLQLPKLELSEDTSVVNQFNKLASKDSILRQQARVEAHESGVPSGSIHSSQASGAAQKTLMDNLMPVASREAETALGEETSNWANATNQMITTYENDYAARLTEKAHQVQREQIKSNERIQNKQIAAQKAVAMAQANTQLSNSLLQSTTSLLNNTDIKFGEEVKNKITDIFNRANENNNTILGMGFSY